MIYKYGIRFSGAFLTCIAFQAAAGWEWADFFGRCFVTGLLVATSYPLESWLSKPAKS